MQQRIPYTQACGGFPILVQNKYAYLDNLTNPYLAIISFYLQIMRIYNQSFHSWLIINNYMPYHFRDVRYINVIQFTIIQQIQVHLNHVYILCRNFNHSVALIRQQNEHDTIPLQSKYYKWHTFIENLHLLYVPINNQYSRQGGHKYSSISCIDGLFIYTLYKNLYTSLTHNHLDKP